MRIDRLDFVNYKRFRDSYVELEPNLTVFAGRNGSGKSSILTAVSVLLSWVIARMRSDSGHGLYLNPQDITNCEINGCIRGHFLDGITTVPNKSKPGLFKSYNFEIGGIKDYVYSLRERLTAGDKVSLPVFAFYGVARAVVDIPLRTRQHEYGQFDAYDKCLDGAANFRSFFTWYRACEDWENQQKARQAEATEHLGLRAFRSALRVFMPEYSDIYIERHPLGMWVNKNGESFNVEQLSDGEKIYLALIGDLCHRLSLANPYSANPLEGEGIVLIDEIDLHLHPEWQREITPRLVKTFPNIQFIVTTHSPHVLSSVPTSSVRIMEENGKISNPAYGYGMPVDVILQDLMTLGYDGPVEIHELLQNFYSSVNNGDLKKALENISDIESKVPAHPELTRMRKIYERATR